MKWDEALSVIHIGFPDFQLFADHEEFFENYKMLNVKDFCLFSDKLCLGVVDLSCIEKATEEDKAYGIDHWARLFKATTWEELKMIVEKDKVMQEASQALYELSADSVIRQQCRAREERVRKMRRIKRDEEALKKALEEKKDTIEEQKGTIEEQKGTIEEQKGTIEEQKGTIKEQKAMLEEKERMIEVLLAENARMMAERK